MPAPIRTLFVMTDCYFPPTSGAAQRMWRHIHILSKLGPTALFTAGWNAFSGDTLPDVERWCHVPKPNTPRTAPERLARLLFPAQYPHFDLAHEREANKKLRQFIADFRPTVTVLNHWRYAIAPSPLRHSSVPLIVDSHNVEWRLLRDSTAPSESFFWRLQTNAWISYFRRLEKRLYRSADRTWAVSEADRRAIMRFTGLKSEVRALPIVTDVAYYEPVRRTTLAATSAPSQAGPTIFYAGAYWWEPNVEAAQMLIADVYPALRSMYPGARLLLVGASPTPEMLAAARGDDHIIVTDQVEDIRPYLAQAHVSAVPLLVGGGMRSKIVEAFAAGLPVVSTTKGAEGIGVADGRELLIRDGASNFVAGIKELWENRESARALAERALECAQRDYSMEAMERRIRAELDELLTPKRNSK